MFITKMFICENLKFLGNISICSTYSELIENENYISEYKSGWRSPELGCSVHSIHHFLLFNEHLLERVKVSLQVLQLHVPSSGVSQGSGDLVGSGCLVSPHLPF